jgi:hypothetical protein
LGENYPPTCSDLVHPNRGRVAGLTELARLSLIALCVGLGANKPIILVFVQPVRDAVSGADGRFLADKPISMELRKVKHQQN